MKKLRYILVAVLSAALLCGLIVWWCHKPADAGPDGEPDPPTPTPTLSADEKEIYQNPDGYLSKPEYPLNDASLEYAASRFTLMPENCLRTDGVKVYFSVIPDKNYFMAQAAGVPSMDYAQMVSTLSGLLPDMDYIDIFDCLSLEDYYKTDTHWRQERITDVAETLALGMDVSLSGEYRTEELDVPFYGTYCEQTELDTQPEPLYYLRSDILDACSVYDFETDSEIGVYDMDLAHGDDAYEIFLSGSKSLLRITNPAAENQRRLIIFRDSFGSSLAPLLVSAYAEVNVVDIRYLSSALLDRFLRFENCDVLFIYSTLVLNNSITLK